MKFSIVFVLCLVILSGVLLSQVTGSEIEVDATGDATIKEDAASEETSKVKTKTKKTSKKKSSKDWNKLKFNDLEKEWEDGDEDEELENEYERSERIMARKQKENERKMRKRMPNFDPNNPGSVAEALNKNPDLANVMGGSAGGSGVQMWFVELHLLQQQGPNKGKPWTKQELDKLASQWAELLKTAHMSTNTYNLGKPEKPTLLVSINKAWDAPQVLRFVAHRPETKEMVKDGKKLTRKDFPDEGDD
jgi:hypothetical protein